MQCLPPQPTADPLPRPPESRLPPPPPVAGQFGPGESGNPGGRAKKILTQALRLELAKPFPGDEQGRTYGQVIAAKLVAAAAAGDLQAAREVADRVEGKAAQSVELSDTRVPVIVGPEELTSEEWQKRFAGGGETDDDDAGEPVQ